MAASNISALIIQHNNDVYINDGVTPGKMDVIPTIGAGAVIDGDYWAVPVSSGVVSGFQYVPTTPGSTDAPDGQAFHVVRISSRLERDDWYVFGTSSAYIQASNDAECCESPAFDMPTDVPDLSPCQVLCPNSDGNGFGVFGLPSPDGGTYAANGFYNGDELPQVTGTTAALLVTALNGNGTWAAIGTWAKSADNLTLTVTQAPGAGDDVICLRVTFL